MPYAYETTPHISLTCKLVPVLYRKLENVSIWRYAPSSISASSDTAYGQITSQSDKLPVLLKSNLGLSAIYGPNTLSRTS